MLICEQCHKGHDGSYASGRFCSPECASKSRRKNRAKTIARKKKLGGFKQFKPAVSKLQIGVSRLLSKHGIPHKVQEQVGKYYFDIKIGNILLQVNGDYWHANPTKYNAGSVIKYPGNKKKLACNVWKRDLKKKLQATKRGYRVIYIWQSQVKKMNEGVLMETIMKRMRTQENRLND